MQSKQKPHSVLDDLEGCFSVIAKFVGRHPEPDDLDALESLSKIKFGVEYLEEQLESARMAIRGLTSGLKYLSREQIMEADAAATAILDVPCGYVQDALRVLDTNPSSEPTPLQQAYGGKVRTVDTSPAKEPNS